MIGNIGAVFLFEWKRMLTVPRMAWSAVLAAFPVFIIGMVRFITRNAPAPPPDVWLGLCAWLLFAMVPMLVSMLGTLLWATPAVSVELERRSWVYLAVRPNGSTAVLLGKYLAAITWVIPPALAGLTVAVPLANTGDGLRIWLTMTGLVLLSCPAYGAIYLLLGVLMPRRAMVFAVGYTLLFELIISFIPAVINKITVQYRLRALAVNWGKLKIISGPQSNVMTLFGEEPAWVHVMILISLTAALLATSVAVLRFSEFSTSAETDS